jgi:peptide/nickel transport system substrate-binding protein
MTKRILSDARRVGLAAVITALMPFTLVSAPAVAEEIRIVMTSEPQDLDPGNVEFRFTGQVARHSVIEGLVLHDLRTQEIKPRLATAWERTGELSWRFTLREGVTFHDGAPFNADAVIASYERLMVPEIEQVNRSRFFEGLELTITQVDEHVIDVNLNRPEPLFLQRFANLPIVSPNMSQTELSRAPVGTGPFRFVTWDAGVQIVLERNEDYWGATPETTRAVFMWRNEPSVRASMVQVGEADLTFSIDEEAATNDATDQAYRSFEVLYYIIGAWEPPLDDVRVREAVNLSIDREAMFGTILPAQSVPAVALFGPTTTGHNPDLAPHPYDPERARALLAEARADGVPVDTQIQVLGINGHFPRSDEVLEAVTAMLSASGFNVVSRTMEAGLFRQYRDKPRVEEGPVLLQANHDNATGDAGTSLARHRCETVRNPICDSRIDEMLDAGFAAEGEERAAIWRELARYMHQEVQVDGLIAHRVAFGRVAERVNYTLDGLPESHFFLEEVTYN